MIFTQLVSDFHYLVTYLADTHIGTGSYLRTIRIKSPIKTEDMTTKLIIVEKIGINGLLRNMQHRYQPNKIKTRAFISYYHIIVKD